MTQSGRGEQPLRTLLWRSGRTDLGRVHWLRHAVEDRDALAAAAGGECLGGCTVAAIDVLPVVHHPHSPSWADGEVRLHLQAATDIAAEWRNLVAGLHAGRAVLGADATELHDWTVRHREVGDPDIVVAVNDYGPWPRKTAACERRTRKLRAVGSEQRDTAAPSRLL